MKTSVILRAHAAPSSCSKQRDEDDQTPLKLCTQPTQTKLGPGLDVTPIITTAAHTHAGSLVRFSKFHLRNADARGRGQLDVRRGAASGRALACARLGILVELLAPEALPPHREAPHDHELKRHHDHESIREPNTHRHVDPHLFLHAQHGVPGAHFYESVPPCVFTPWQITL